MTAGTPTRLVLSAWTFIAALYAIGPLTYTHPPGLATWAFIGTCLSAFIVGCQAERLHAPGIIRARSIRSSAEVSDRRINLIVRTCAILSLVGMIGLGSDKLLLSGLDYSIGITALRYERTSQALAGEAGPQRSLLVYFGYLTFAFSVVAYLLYLLRSRALSRSSIWLAHLAMLSPASMALLYGARAPVVIVLAIAIGAMLVRSLTSDPSVTRASIGRRSFVVFVLLAMFYNSYIFTERRVFAGVQDYFTFAKYFQATTATIIPASVDELIERRSAYSDMFMGLLSTDFYLTQGFSVLDRMWTYDGPLGPYFGAYNLYILVSLFSHITGSTSLGDTINNEAAAADVGGWFATALGAMYIDFGTAGSLILLFLLGWISNRIYRDAVVERDLRKQLVMSFVVAAILISPVQSILSVSVSLPILCSILVSNRFLRPYSVQTAGDRSGRLAASVTPLSATQAGSRVQYRS